VKENQRFADPLVRMPWNRANRNRLGLLDCGRRDGHRPVLRQKFPDGNLQVPPDEARTDAICTMIPKHRRHRCFIACPGFALNGLWQSMSRCTVHFDSNVLHPAPMRDALT